MTEAVRRRPRGTAWSDALLAAARSVTEQLRDRELQRLARRLARHVAADGEAQRPGSNGSEAGATAIAPDPGGAAA